MTYGIQKALNQIAGTDGLGEQSAANAAVDRIRGAVGYIRPGEYYQVGNTPANTTIAGLTQNELRTIPMLIGNRTRIVDLACETTAAGTATNRTRLGIYADNGQTYPGSLIVETSALATDGAAGYYNQAIDVTLAPGLYWFALVSQVAAAPTYRAINGLAVEIPLSTGTSRPGSTAQTGYRQTGVTGALPATFSTTVDLYNNAPRIVFQTAAL